MRIFSGLFLSLLFGACSTTVTHPPQSAKSQSPPLPASPDEKHLQLTIENEQDLLMALSYAHLQGERWEQAERARTEAWVLREIETRLSRQKMQDAAAIWAPLADWHARTLVKPSDAFLHATRQLMDRAARAGAVPVMLRILGFLERVAPDKLPPRELFDGMIELERVRIEQCRFENAQQKEHCLAQGTLEKDAYQMLPPWAAPGDTEMLGRISFALWGVPAGTAFSAIPEWILKNAPHEAKLHEADHWFGLCLFENGCFRKPPAGALESMAGLNSYVHEAWANLISGKPSPAMLESLASYLQERLGPAFALRLCEHEGTALFPGHPRAALCRNRVFNRIEYSLLRRTLLINQIRATPNVREIWEELFQTTVQRFFHFAEREQLELAHREYAYLEQLVSRMETRWPSSEQRNSLVVQTLAISELYLLRGQVEKTRDTAQRVFGVTRDPRLLQMLFRVEFWSGNYAKAVEIAKKMEEMAQSSVQNKYLYFRQSRYYALALEHLGESQAAGQLRAQAAAFFKALFDFVSDPDLRTELVVNIAELYFDAGQKDTGVQLFQAALSRSPSCDVLSHVLKNLIVYDQVDAAFDVYHTIMDSDSCSSNRKLYASIWLRFFGLRHTVTDERMENVNEFLNEYKGEAWLSALASFARAKISRKQLLAMASNVGQQAEALYYGGLSAWANGDAKTAFDLFRQVQGLRILNYTEHEFAFWHFEMQKRTPLPAEQLPDLSSKDPTEINETDGETEDKSE